jgi:hypothetical protein
MGELNMKNILSSRKIQRLLLSLSLVFLGLVGWFSYSTYVVAPKEGFRDLPPTYWAYDTVMWAVDQEIITGYANGKIKPNKLVSEAEILAMLFRTFGDVPTSSPTTTEESAEGQAPAGDWAVKYYNQAIAMNWEVWGRHSRNELITRIDLAVIVSGALGYHLTEDGAIQTLLDLGIMEGKHSSTIDGFGAGEVTRAEALQVMRNIVKYGLTDLQARPQSPSAEPTIDSPFIQRVQPLRKLGEERGYETWSTTWSREAGFTQQNEGIVYFTYRSESSPDNQVVLYAADQAKHRQFVQDLFVEMGLPVDASFNQMIAKTMNQAEPIVQKFGQWQFILSRGNIENIVQISFRKEG